jgi:hypothetical protein
MDYGKDEGDVVLQQAKGNQPAIERGIPVCQSVSL